MSGGEYGSKSLIRNKKGKRDIYRYFEKKKGPFRSREQFDNVIADRVEKKEGQ